MSDRPVPRRPRRAAVAAVVLVAAVIAAAGGCAGQKGRNDDLPGPHEYSIRGGPAGIAPAGR